VGGHPGRERRARLALYGDVNMNLIDGSSVWLQSLARTLLLGDRVDVTLLLKAPRERGVLTDALAAPGRLEVVEPRGRPLTVRAALDELERLDRSRRFDAVILRGYRLAREAAGRRALRGRLWVYLTDIPQTLDAVTSEDRASLARIVDASRFLLCQTEELRAFLEALVPEASPKTALLPPMIPPWPERPVRAPARDRGPRLVYTGKFAPLWGILEMVAALPVIRQRFPGAELVVVGDKIHDPREDPSFRPAVERALRTTEGVRWLGGLPRERVAEVLGAADIGLGVRDPRMNASLELSTKLLEYGAAGLPVVCNRTAMHERLLGADYPGFVSDPAELPDVVAALWSDPERWRRAAEACARASRDFTFPRVWGRLAPLIERVAPRRDVARAARPLRLLVAGHDLKFFAAIQRHFEAFRSVEVRVDRWAGLAAHDPRRSRAAARWADVVVCEWCLGNAVFYSRRKRPGQRLIVRFHRFEIDTPHPADVAIDAVDEVVFVSPHARDGALARLGWPTARARVIPNAVDVLALDRPKGREAPFTLGMLGFVPRRKRLDRALDLVELVRARDPRFRLSVKGWPPWSYSWVWERALERAHYRAAYRRIAESPLLGDAVAFEPGGPDVPAWLRGVGFVLSTSDDESFHVAPVEGMASGAVPVVLAWPGARHVYPSGFVHASVEEAAAFVIETVGSGSWRELGRAARAFALERYGLEAVLPMWEAVLLGEEPVAVSA
jgi:glycosyltransferase involved in cell wall biosynthesis